MKKIVTAIALSSIITSSFAVDLKKEDSKVAYTIGNQIGSSLQTVNSTIKLDKSILFDGITDGINNKKSKLSEKEMNTVMIELRKKLEKKIEEKTKKESAKNKAASENFLKSNAKKAGVKTTKSGLQYKVIKQGKGKKPQKTDIVIVKYKGNLINGKEFDNSKKTGGPVEIPLNAVIPGWTEGLQLMTTGSIYEFVIPSNLAYGKTAPPTIGPDQALIFNVELVGIKKAKKK